MFSYLKAVLTLSKYGQLGCWMETREQKQSESGSDSMVMRMLSELEATNGEKRDVFITGEDRLNVASVSLVLDSFGSSFQSSQGVDNSTFKLTSTFNSESDRKVIDSFEFCVMRSIGQRSTDLAKNGTVMAILLLSLVRVYGILKLFSVLPPLIRTKILSPAFAPSTEIDMRQAYGLDRKFSKVSDKEIF